MYLIQASLVAYLFSGPFYRQWSHRYFDEVQRQYLSPSVYGVYSLGYFLNLYLSFNLIGYNLNLENELSLNMIYIFMIFLLHINLWLATDWILAFLNLDKIKK